MARRVFFSFHYEKDVWRASQVRNSWVTYGHGDAAGFWDAASWESVQRQGKAAVHTWIDRQMLGTSVTVVLIGSSTAEREYVHYEIERSYDSGKGILGIYVHNMKDQNGFTSPKGMNPLGLFEANTTWGKTRLSQLYKTYDWAYDDGYDNFGDWVEQAAADAGR